MTVQPRYLTGDPAGIKQFIDKFDVFLFDCDGVLWSGDEVFPNTAEIIDLLRKKGKRTIFVTNNSTKSRADYAHKLAALHIPSTIDDVVNSSYSAALYISLILRPQAPCNKVFVLGESGIETELTEAGIPFIGGTDPRLRRDVTPADYAAIAKGEMLDEGVGVVLAGLDFHLNYLKLCLAYHYIADRGATFLATNADVTLPASGTVFPGAGACTAPLVAMLEGGSGVGKSKGEADREKGKKTPISLGKPDQAMMEAVKGKFQFDPERACMVGDRLNTDIAFGVEAGLGGTLCVLTGVTKGREDWEAEGAPVRPAFWVDGLADLLAGGE